MSHTVFEYCECAPGGHDADCPLFHRLVIKDRMCRRMKVVNYIEPRIADAIDRLVARRLQNMRGRGWTSATTAGAEAGRQASGPFGVM